MSPPKGKLNDNEKLLFQKVQEGSTEEVKAILNSKDARVDCLDEHGMTPLQNTAYRGNYDLTKFLLDCGADVNSNFHESGYSALMFAGLTGKLDVVSLFLEHGASTTYVNSVGRTASQMSAFVGNHDVVTLINNFIPMEEIEYFTKIQGLEKEPRLSHFLVKPFYRLVLKTNVHPVKLALYFQDNKVLLDESERIAPVLELLTEKEIKKNDGNEVMALKFHHITFILKTCAKFYKKELEKQEESKAKDGILEPLIKSWLKGNDESGFPVLLEQLLRQSVREFGYRESSIFQQLVRTLSSTHIGDEPSAISIVLQTSTGQKGFDDVPCCSSCGEPKAEKRCSVCKSVQYCNQKCQKLHWFTHKKVCPNLAKSYQMAEQLRKECDVANAVEDKAESDKGKEPEPEAFEENCSLDDMNAKIAD